MGCWKTGRMAPPAKLSAPNFTSPRHRMAQSLFVSSRCQSQAVRTFDRLAQMRRGKESKSNKKPRRLNMKKLVLAVTVLALSTLSVAQILPTKKVNTQQEVAAALAQENAAQAVPRSPLATMTCSFTFTSGANNTYLKYCVTVNGNITQLQTPLGHEHIAVGTFGEGYGVCDTTTGVAYDDYAGFGDSGNWGVPVTTQPNATTVKVVRSTSDGIWTLTQTITQVAATSSVKVAMALKNNTAIARTAYLMRYADVDADGIFKNNLDGTH